MDLAIMQYEVSKLINRIKRQVRILQHEISVLDAQKDNIFNEIFGHLLAGQVGESSNKRAQGEAWEKCTRDFSSRVLPLEEKRKRNLKAVAAFHGQQRTLEGLLVDIKKQHDFEDRQSRDDDIGNTEGLLEIVANETVSLQDQFFKRVHIRATPSPSNASAHPPPPAPTLDSINRHLAQRHLQPSAYQPHAAHRASHSFPRRV